MPTPKNLFEYYKSLGKPLPSISDRSILFEQQGLGEANQYLGTAEQNTSLLTKLIATPIPSPTPVPSPSSTPRPAPIPSPIPAIPAPEKPEKPKTPTQPPVGEQLPQAPIAQPGQPDATRPPIQQAKAVQGQPGAPTGQIDATIGVGGQAPLQVGGRFGTQQFGRIGNDVYEIMSDSSRRKVTETEFSQKLRAQGLNLEVLPQLDVNDNVADVPGGLPNPDINADGTPKGPSDFLTDNKNIIKELGLSDIKAEFEKNKQAYVDLQDKKNAEIAEINNDPWLSEVIRQKEVKKINTKYELKENTISNLMKYNESLYEEGLEQAKFITSGIQTDRNKLLDLALKRDEALRKLTEVDTQVVQTSDGRDVLIDKKTGKIISVIGGPKRKRPSDEDTFSDTQTNKGAANAGMPIDVFTNLDEDTKNYYINKGDDIAKAKVLIKKELDGGASLEDVINEINKQNTPRRVKYELIKHAQDNYKVPGVASFFFKSFNPLTYF